MAPVATGGFEAVDALLKLKDVARALEEKPPTLVRVE
jgi:hypothetical protein